MKKYLLHTQLALLVIYLLISWIGFGAGAGILIGAALLVSGFRAIPNGLKKITNPEGKFDPGFMGVVDFWKAIFILMWVVPLLFAWGVTTSATGFGPLLVISLAAAAFFRWNQLPETLEEEPNPDLEEAENIQREHRTETTPPTARSIFDGPDDHDEPRAG